MLSALTIAAPALKRKIMKKESISGSTVANLSDEKSQDNIFLAFVYYFIYSTLHVLNMLLIMTFNGGVLISMLIGMSASYFIFGSKDADADMPINCCASPA